MKYHNHAQNDAALFTDDNKIVSTASEGVITSVDQLPPKKNGHVLIVTKAICAEAKKLGRDDVRYLEDKRLKS